jgi:predicted nuclease with RNAse H fold
VEELCVKVIDEVQGAEDTHTHYHTDDGTSDFMSTAAVALTTPLHLTSVEIARREIEVWKSQTLLLPETSNPLREWRRGVKIFPCLSLLARRVLAMTATSTSPERLFSTSGNTMTKKRWSLSCDNLEECLYFHEDWSQVRKWSADRKVLDMDYIIILTFSFRREFLDL